MDEKRMRALAKRFFDAVEAGDIEAVGAIYAPGAVIWHNTDGLETGREANLETLRGFTRLIGEPPMRYLARWRIQLAAHQLRNTDTPLARIAAQVGYESEAAFNRAFKRHFGVPPAAWRKKASTLQAE